MKKSFLGFIIGILISALLASFAGENPFHTIQVLFESAFGSSYDMGLTLFYATSYIFTGLSVAIAFHAGLFNIGAEGQLTMGVLAASWIGVLLPNLPYPLSTLVAILAALIFGAIWGFIPGWLRAYRKSHEVIVTMMLNFIAAGLANYVVLNLIKNPNTQNPESAPVGQNYHLLSHDFIQNLFTDSPANFSFIIAILVALLIHFVLDKTVFGFELKASGANEEAAHMSGIESKKFRMLAMTISGMLASLVALNEVLGSAHRFRIGFSVDYGFVGIAVALLARNNPLGIIFSGLLFGVLQKGASDLDIETEFITRDFGKVIQAILILSITVFYFSDLERIKKWMKRKS